MTGDGMAAKTAASSGRNASAIRRSPAGSATARLVAPVAIERPMFDEKVDCPTPPRRPASVEPTEPARMPPLTDVMSVRFQPVSFTFWQRVRSPTVFRTELRLAIRNGPRSTRSKVMPPGIRRGRLTIGPSRMPCSWSGVRMPSAKAAPYPTTRPMTTG